MDSFTGQSSREIVRSSAQIPGSVLKHTEQSHAPKRRATLRKPALPNSHYTVAMICPLPLEKAAATAMLDEEHQSLRSRREGDDNTYTLGSMHTEQGTHHVVIVGMGKDDIGILPASTVAQNLRQSFPEANICLVMGVAGGVPNDSHRLYLGDVVVGMEVIHYDPQRVLQDTVVRTGTSSRPPPFLRSAVSHLETMHEVSGSRVPQILEQRRKHLQRYIRPSLEDRLFDVECVHSTRAGDDGEDDPASDPCRDCEPSKIRRRRQPSSTHPNIHYGRIGSGNSLLRSSEVREELGNRNLGVLCFEMESAGIMATLPCITIRGIADYADSHKNKNWQRYAAATAAAYSRELLDSITPVLSDGERELTPRTTPQAEGLSVPLQQRQDQFIESIRFSRMDQRRQDIDTPQTSTCKWLLKEPAVRQWLNDAQFPQHQGLLLLTGNAGTGKSTCVNYLFDWHKRQKAADRDSSLFASFFFHNRGVELEKSVLGMYRALLLQLFTGYPDLLDLLDHFSFQSIGAVVGRPPPLSALKHLFREALLNLNGRSFVCYVDALDEGNVQDVRDMAEFFQTLATDPQVSTSGLFRVMFSSRPYPFVIKQWRGAKFALQEADGHRRDLERYVRDHLQDAEPIIIATILEKANGVFLWVKLVASILFDDYLSHGRPCDLERLRNTPSELEDLYRDMLERDKTNWDEFTVAMTWILYGRGHLTAGKFSVALELGLEVEQHGSYTLSKVPSSNDAMLRKRVVSATKGLAEVAGGYGNSSPVQLIHESVQEFLKRGGLNDVLSTSNFHSPTICHGRLANYCLCFLRTPVVLRSLDVTSLNRFGNPKLSGEHDFTVYTVREALGHAIASEDCIPSGFVTDFPEEVVGLEMRSVRGTGRQYDWSLLHECANRGYLSLLKFGNWTDHYLRMHLNAQTDYYDSPLHLASGQGHLPVVQTLVEWGADIDLCSDGKCTPLMMAIKSGKETVAQWLISQGPNMHTVDSYGRTALHLATGRGFLQLITSLIERGAVITTENDAGLTPLMTAVHLNVPSAARLLIDAGATLTEPYGEKEMELVFAVRASDAESCQSLVNAGAEKNIRSRRGATPLHIAVSNNCDAICRVLVNAGADLEARNDNGETCLMRAVRGGCLEIVKLLLEGGANIHACDGEGQTALNMAKDGVLEYMRSWTYHKSEGLKPVRRDDARWKRLMKKYRPSVHGLSRRND